MMNSASKILANVHERARYLHYVYVGFAEKVFFDKGRGAGSREKNFTVFLSKLTKSARIFTQRIS